MSQLVDLSIMLNSPPQGSSPETIASITLNCSAVGMSHRGALLSDPLTQRERENLRWYLEEYWKWPYEGFAQRGREVEAFLPQLGQRLYKAVFGEVAADRIVQKWLSLSNVQHQIYIVSEIPKVLSLPWELLHNKRDFVAFANPPTSIIRTLPQDEVKTVVSPFQLPLRILLVTARPSDVGFIDPRSIAHELLDEVQDQIGIGAVELEFLRPPTMLALKERLENRSQPIHILHFDGHGMFGRKINIREGQEQLNEREQGLLAFEDNKGKCDWIKGEELVNALRDSSVHLVVLNACQSAVSSVDDVFSSISTQLVRGGMDGVVAMSANFLVVSAVHYVETFYRMLTTGIPVPMAQRQALLALYKDLHRHPHRRHLDEEGSSIILHDWWLPHLYQQRPLILQSAHPLSPPKPLKHTFPSLSETMPLDPNYGFSGRAHDLLSLERLLRRKWIVVVHGFGGVGKTALVREVAAWLTRTGMYDGAYYVTFEEGGDASMLLTTFSSYLGVVNREDSSSTKKILALLKPTLKEKRILVIADHIETILTHGEKPLTSASRTQLWGTLLELRDMDAGVLLVSRDTAFADERMTLRNRVIYHELKGLHFEDAYAFAARILDTLKLDRAQALYTEVYDLLVQLDYNPLAIQLVFPVLREYAPTKVQADFVALLTQFVDNMGTGRNRSLLISLDYSLRRLSEEHRVLLSRLVPFEGGGK